MFPGFGAACSLRYIIELSHFEHRGETEPVQPKPTEEEQLLFVPGEVSQVDGRSNYSTVGLHGVALAAPSKGWMKPEAATCSFCGLFKC